MCCIPAAAIVWAASFGATIWSTQQEEKIPSLFLSIFGGAEKTAQKKKKRGEDEEKARKKTPVRLISSSNFQEGV